MHSGLNNELLLDPGQWSCLFLITGNSLRESRALSHGKFEDRRLNLLAQQRTRTKDNDNETKRRAFSRH
jgi:hypothetical protein